LIKTSEIQGAIQNTIVLNYSVNCT